MNIKKRMDISRPFNVLLGSACLCILTIATASAQDWPNLGRYTQANSIVPPVKTGEQRVVYMGDSITDFWINNDSTFFAGKPYHDRGISGQTTGQMLLRFRQDVINLKPAVVVILAGINDIAENNGPAKLEDTFGNIVSMAELSKANHIKVILCSILPAAAFPWRPAINPISKVKAVNQMLKEYAIKNNITYLDYFIAMADANGGLPANLSKDGVHPNLQGYKVMEPLAEQAIARAINSK
jgi:lysophospholipase L1-like esterase